MPVYSSPKAARIIRGSSNPNSLSTRACNVGQSREEVCIIFNNSFLSITCACRRSRNACAATPLSEYVGSCWQGVSETRLASILQTTGAETKAEMKACIEAEVRAAIKYMTTANDAKLASMEAAMKAETAQILTSVASGLKYVMHEVVSQLVSAGGR